MGFTQSEVLQYVEENDVKFIKLLFTDLFGHIKSMNLQPNLLRKAFSEGISFDASAVPGFLDVSTSDLFLVPDPSTLSVLPWRPQHGRVARLYCNIFYQDGTPFEGDTRCLLQNVMKKAGEMGYDIRVGTECEFYLFKLDENGVPSHTPSDTAGYCELSPIDRCENVRRDIVLNLEKMGLEPEISHHEAGPGQNEIDFRHSSAVVAADNFSTFKITVKTIAAQSGHHASFMPKPIPEKAGSGLHINMSLYKNGENLFAKDAPETRQFVAGILNHIREISLVLNPMHQSYERLGKCEAPRYVSWSSQNRSQLIRVPAATGDSKRIELRSPDPSCNQYLALALIIAAGLEGIEKSMEPPATVDKNLFENNPADVAGLERLPETLEEAVKLFAESEFTKRVIPQISHDAFVNYKSNWKDPEFGEL